MKIKSKPNLRSIIIILLCSIIYISSTCYGFYRKMYIPSIVLLFSSVFFTYWFIIYFKAYFHDKGTKH